MLRPDVALICSLAEPEGCRLIILMRALAVGIQEPHTVLGLRVTLVCGLFDPVEGRLQIMRHALGMEVGEPEVELGDIQSLLGSFAEPLCSFDVILRDAERVRI